MTIYTNYIWREFNKNVLNNNMNKRSFKITQFLFIYET